MKSLVEVPELMLVEHSYEEETARQEAEAFFALAAVEPARVGYSGVSPVAGLTFLAATKEVVL